MCQESVSCKLLTMTKHAPRYTLPECSPTQCAETRLWRRRSLKNIHSPFFSFGVTPVVVLALALPPPLVSARSAPVCPGEGGARCCMLRAPTTPPPPTRACWGRSWCWRWGRASCSRRDIDTALPGLRRGVAVPDAGLSSRRMVRVGTRSVRRLCAVLGVPNCVRPFSSPGGRASGLEQDAAWYAYSLFE